jgi:hypothetical protein
MGHRHASARQPVLFNNNKDVSMPGYMAVSSVMQASLHVTLYGLKPSAYRSYEVVLKWADKTRCYRAGGPLTWAVWHLEARIPARFRLSISPARRRKLDFHRDHNQRGGVSDMRAIIKSRAPRFSRLQTTSAAAAAASCRRSSVNKVFTIMSFVIESIRAAACAPSRSCDQVHSTKGSTKLSDAILGLDERTGDRTGVRWE